MADNDHVNSGPDGRSDAYSSALINAWFATRMEKDKTLLALSAGGIALLAGLLTGLGVRSLCQLILYVLAAAAFLIAVFSAIAVFSHNATYLEREKAAFEAGKPGVGEDPSLVRLDALLIYSFIAGVILTLTVALFSALPIKQAEDQPMSDKSHKETTTQSVPRKRSFSGASAMRPAQQQGDSRPSNQQSESSSPNESSSGAGDSGSSSSGDE